MPGFDINRLRLHNQHLAKPELTQPADIVRWLGAVQAQDYAGAKWALGQRLKGATDQLVEEAFNRGDIIRTHVMRPTWHFLAAEDVRWMLDLSAAHIHAGVVHAHRTFGLDETVFSKATHIIAKLLEGGRHIARNEIVTALKEGSIPTNELRCIHILMELELRQLICSGPRQGKQFTYTLLDKRVPVSLKLSRDEALAKLSERYFTAHGPATLHDYSWWSGLTLAECKAGLEMIRHKLLSETIKNSTYWFADQLQDTGKISTAYLLPNYDEYIVSYKDRSSTIHAKDVNKADPRGTIFNHTVIINGRIAGIWKRLTLRNKATLEIVPFKRLSKGSENAITAATKRYVKFEGIKEWEWVSR